MHFLAVNTRIIVAMITIVKYVLELQYNSDRIDEKLEVNKINAVVFATEKLEVNKINTVVFATDCYILPHISLYSDVLTIRRCSAVCTHVMWCMDVILIF